MKIMAVLAKVSTLRERLPSVLVDPCFYYCCTMHQALTALRSLCTKGCARTVRSMCVGVRNVIREFIWTAATVLFAQVWTGFLDAYCNAGVANIHRALSLPSLTHRNQVLHLALRGVRCSAHTGRHPRQPLTTPVLRVVLCGVTTSKALHRQDKRMLKVALLLGFYSFLRVSEFTAPSQWRFNPCLHATSANICLATDMYYINFI